MKYTPLKLLVLLLFVQPAFAKDKIFIESFCTMKGLQELILSDSGKFSITSYHNKKSPLTMELQGEWILDSQRLLLQTDSLELAYLVTNKPIEISGQHILVTYMEPIKDESGHPLNQCEFTDKRVLKRLMKEKKAQAIQQ